MSERLKKTPVWHKVFGVIETLALAACATGERIGLVTPTPEGTKTNPTEIVPTPSAGTIPTSAAETGTGMSVEFLGQDEVLATKLSETLTLENLYVKFKEDTQIKGLFANPDAVEYSAMGIKAHIAESGKTVSYPFFSAMSESEQKGYTAMVLQPSAEEVVYVVLNRITDAEGKVGLGITQDLNHQLLEKPVMVFATGLTADQIAGMTDEELSRINLLFVPVGLPVSPSEAPLGVGNYLASLKPVEPTPTPTEAPTQENYSFSSSIDPENLQVVIKDLSIQPESYVIDLTEAKGRPLVVAGGYIISYELTSDNGERSMYVLFSTTGGVLKAKIDYVLIARGSWPQPHLRISELTQAQASKVSDYLNNVINCNYTGSDRCDLGNTLGDVGMVAINNEDEAGMCRKDLAKLNNSEQLCFYDSSLGKISPQEMEAKIRSAIVSTKNKSPEEILNFDSPNTLLSAEGNAYIVLQIPVIK